MSLSVCLISSAPAARVAAVLEPVRELADEVVIAADSRVDDERLAGYATLADRLFRIEFRLYERHLAWLHAQCTGDWILRLDDDEVLSAALAARLPELLAARDVQQYWVARAWLYPDAGSVLDDLPWSVDFNNRLVRNDGTLRFRGDQHAHADPVEPCEYVEDPVYHLELLDAGIEERRDKAIRYEVANPLVTAPGGGRINEAFYLPELRPSLRTRPVPEVDRAAVERARTARGAIAGAEGWRAPLVTADETDRHWDGRAVPESAYRATIEPVGTPPALAAGQGRTMPFRVANEGTEQWPRGLDRRPAIRASYHWLHPDGSVHAADGLRTGFSRDVYPGDRILVPLQVVAPPAPGRYVLEVDLVHEGVRWFEQSCRIEVEVEVATAPVLPPTPLRLRESPPPATRRLGRPRMRIPRVLHRVWVGPAEMPDAYVEFGHGFARLHPDWEMRLWTDADLASLDITDAERGRARSPAELSNVVRYEVVKRFGGVFFDADMECRQPLDGLLAGVEAFAALELPGRAACGALGAVPGHRVFERAARLSRRTLGLGPHSADANGPYFLSLILEQEPGVTLFGADKFYPYHWEEPERAGDPFPGAYAVHHWSLSWYAQEGVG
jgi:Glycosyltransferase sugar-binding region containing DXD motif